TPTVAARAAAYNMPGLSVDGADLLAVYAAAAEARERALRGEGPTLIDAHVSRLTPHSSDDDDRRYRDPAELAHARDNDPLLRTRTYLRQVGLLDEAAEIALAER